MSTCLRRFFYERFSKRKELAFKDVCENTVYKKTFLFDAAVQCGILGIALYQQWDPFLMLFVYLCELIVATLIGFFQSVRFGKLSHLPLHLFMSGVIIAFTGALLFVVANIFQPFNVDQVSGNFAYILQSGFALTWTALAVNSCAFFVKALATKHTIDPFFYALAPLVRLIPLVFSIIFFGFLALLGATQAMLVGMAAAHIYGDYILSLGKNESNASE